MSRYKQHAEALEPSPQITSTVVDILQLGGSASSMLLTGCRQKSSTTGVT